MRKVAAKTPKKSRPGVKNSSTADGPKNTVKRHTQKKGRKSTDPDALALSKNDILEFCDRVLKKWQQDPAKNARNMPAMLAVRTSIFFSDEQSLRAIWSEIISWVYQLLYQNAQAQARQEGQEWAEVFSNIKNNG